MGLVAVDGAVHRRAGRHLGLHALHHDAAAGRPALAAARSPSRRRRSTACRGSFVFFRITLPMLMPYIITATLFRLLDRDPAVRHHLCHDARRARRHADWSSRSRPISNFFQYTNVGRSAALLIILWAITYFLSNIFIKQWLQAARTRPWHGVGGRRWNTPPPLERILRGVAARRWS